MPRETVLKPDQLDKLLQYYPGQALPAGMTALIHSLLDKTARPPYIADDYLAIQKWSEYENIIPARILAQQTIMRVLPSRPSLKKIGIDTTMETMTDIDLFRSLVLVSRSAWYVYIEQKSLASAAVFNDLGKAKAFIDKSEAPSIQKTAAILLLHAVNEVLKKSQ